MYSVCITKVFIVLFYLLFLLGETQMPHFFIKKTIRWQTHVVHHDPLVDHLGLEELWEVHDEGQERDRGHVREEAPAAGLRAVDGLIKWKVLIHFF